MLAEHRDGRAAQVLVVAAITLLVVDQSRVLRCPARHRVLARPAVVAELHVHGHVPVAVVVLSRVHS